MRVAFIAAECEPWAKTGGLADVVDALARALGQVGSPEVEGPVDVFIPNYRGVPVPADATARDLSIPDPRNPGRSLAVRTLEAVTHGYRLHLVDHPPAFDREGMYGTPSADHPDNAWRFGILCRVALERLRLEPRPPDVIHIHDWHAVPAQLQRDDDLDARSVAGLAAGSGLAGAAFVLTIHNLAYHGWIPVEQVHDLGLGRATVPKGADGLDLLRAGIERADLVNTVSPGFAAEALTPKLGMGLDGVLRARGDRFIGILNGLDTDLWNPATDATLAATYSRGDRSGKARCREGLLTELGLNPADPQPVLAMIGRLDRQKGFDLLAAAAPALLRRGVRLAVLGSGSPDVVAPLRGLAATPKGKRGIALIERFDRDLARRMYAGADGFLMPSRFEPCGTGQMIALRYGTPPIVRATGGLRDTVIDVTGDPKRGTGFAFKGESPGALVDACDRFLAAFRPGSGTWEDLLDRGMAVDFDWRSASAPAYLGAYKRAVAAGRTLSTGANQT
jgi:starch synthase